VDTGKKLGNRAVLRTQVVKRSRLLAAEAEQTRVSITSRQRRLFTRTLFAQAASIVSPSLWSNVIHEAPGTVSAVRAVFLDWFAAAKSRLERSACPSRKSNPNIVMV
jgi:small-conductance mechanosensitive channel